MGKIYVGTSGWSYPNGEGTWNGYFYPPGTKNELEYYSRFFNTVEVNSSFYLTFAIFHISTKNERKRLKFGLLTRCKSVEITLQ